MFPGGFSNVLSVVSLSSIPFLPFLPTPLFPLSPSQHLLWLTHSLLKTEEKSHWDSSSLIWDTQRGGGNGPEKQEHEQTVAWTTLLVFSAASWPLWLGEEDGWVEETESYFHHVTQKPMQEVPHFLQYLYPPFSSLLSVYHPRTHWMITSSWGLMTMLYPFPTTHLFHSKYTSLSLF